MLKITHSTAKTVQIESPEFSWGIFCYNKHGDLFLKSDWGDFAYSWRAFGDDFEAFLANADEHYIVQKLENNRFQESRKALSTRHQQALKGLVRAFCQTLKTIEK